MEHLSPKVKLICCHQCGAPVQTTLTAREFNCNYCDSLHQILGERPNLNSEDQEKTLPESDRLTKLRTEAASKRWLLYPPSLKKILKNLPPGEDGSGILLKHWQALRLQLEQHSNNESVDNEFYCATLELSNRIPLNNPKRRAFFETALNAFHSDSRKQIILGFLSRNASLLGDIDSAREWLSYCNPLSEDLSADSSFRISQAMIALVENNPESVLKWLGESSESYPFAAETRVLATLIRADSLEKTSRMDDAVSELTYMIIRPDIQSMLNIYWDQNLDFLKGSLFPALQNKLKYLRNRIFFYPLLICSLMFAFSQHFFGDGLSFYFMSILFSFVVIYWVLVIRNYFAHQRWKKQLKGIIR
jgi:hypothetical protein